MFAKISGRRIGTLMTAVAITIWTATICLAQSVDARSFKRVIPTEKNSEERVPVLWQHPDDISSRNLFYGVGGKEHEPQGKFRFIKEDPGGTNPKFTIEDEQHVRWRVKLGAEARPETTATRLLWAMGYLTDEDYYLPELQVQGMKKLKRGQNFVLAGGKVKGVRLERYRKNEKRIGDWSWFKNPFRGSRELYGLAVMMALINNTDLKQENNSIYINGEIYSGPFDEERYVVADLGATFGQTGSVVDRSIGKLPDYVHSKFIKRVKSEDVDFVMRSRPPFFLLFDLPYYRERTRMEEIVKHIPRTDAKWMGQLLAQLSDQQISDAFRAGGFSATEVEGYTRKIRERIAELNRL
jgi:hypothetical protein